MLRAFCATAALSLLSCATTPAVPPATTANRATCCAQCTSAAQRDPAGMDISVKDCRSYAGADFNGGPGVDPACVAYFAGTPTRLGECTQ